MMYATVHVIIVKISKAWSWKNLNCSNKNDDLSKNILDFHVAISKKSYLYNWDLNPMHYSAILEFRWKNRCFRIRMFIRRGKL